MSVTAEQVGIWRNFYERGHDDSCCSYGCCCKNFGIKQECDADCNCTPGQWHDILDALEEERKELSTAQGELTRSHRLIETLRTSRRSMQEFAESERIFNEATQTLLDDLLRKLRRIQEYALNQTERSPILLAAIRAVLRGDITA